MKVDVSQAARILDELRREFVGHIPQRLAAIEQCWINCSMDADPAPALRELLRLAHSLRGSAKTFGQFELGDAAGRLENALSPWAELGRLPDPAARTILDERIAALHMPIQEVRVEEGIGLFPGHAVGVNPGSLDVPLLYLLEDDPDQARVLVAQLEFFGFRVEAFASVETLLGAVADKRPDACILDIIIDDHQDAGIELAARLHQADAGMPIMFLSVRDDIEARLGAVRAGGLAYLAKPVDAGRLVEAVDQVLGRIETAPCRVLIVDDDESLARYYRSLLMDGDLMAEYVTDPFKVLECITDFSPDLVLMDVYMPRCSGIELALIIRQHGAFAGVPIVFLSVEGDPDIQFKALSQGGDDFMTKPVDPAALLRAVRIRAQRTRMTGTLFVRDSLTGLLNHGRIRELLQNEVARARRGNGILAVALIDLDHLRSINDRYGYATGDRVIRSLARLLLERLRGNDSAGRYGGQQILVMLPGCDRWAAHRLLQDIRSQFAQLTHTGLSSDQSFMASFSMGLAVFPPAIHPDELIAKAHSELQSAKIRERRSAELTP